MVAHTARWRAPQPYWRDQPEAGSDPRFAAPAILRFADDEFMEKLLALMDQAPARLAEFQVRHETWRDFLPQPAAPEEFRLPKSQLLRSLVRSRLAARARVASGAAQAAASGYRLKLYQPAHQRHYMVMTSLVCEVFGFPDRKIDTGSREEAGFVLRRLFPSSAAAADPSAKLPPLDPAGLAGAWVEHAYVPRQDGGEWVAVTDVMKREAGEELLPLSPLGYLDPASSRRRRLLGAVIPVGRREAYMGGARSATAKAASVSAKDLGIPADPRAFLFLAQVIEPWKRLIEQAEKAWALKHEIDLDTKASHDDKLNMIAAAIKASRERTQTASWYLLLDLAQLLETHLPRLWDAISGTPLGAVLSSSEQALYQRLLATVVRSELANAIAGAGARHACAANLGDALKAIRGLGSLDSRSREQIEANLEAVKVPYQWDAPDPLWPSFQFPFADCEHPAPLPIVDALQKSQIVCPDSPDEVNWARDRVDELTPLIDAALAENPVAGAAEAATPAAARLGVDLREGWFLIRCCFERPECGPRCAVMSAPTVPFQLAGFFDPDAPARPIRIGLPLDTTPAGLRKFDKNAMFAISDVLCGQINRLKAITFGDLVRSVLPWPLHKDLDVGGGTHCGKDASLQLGMICSLSIPIITICALILLLIMVSLLDMIFGWLPYLFMCFPIPGLRAKEKD